MKSLTALLSTLFLITATAFANDVRVFSVDNSNGKITPKTIEAAFAKAGFYISDNRDMNTPFMKQFQQTDFDIYNLFTLYHVDIVHKLAGNYPQIGLFAPMSMSIYTRKGTNTIHVASLTMNAMAKITGIPANNAELKQLGQLVEAALKEALPGGAFETFAYEVQKTDKELVTRFELELDPDEWEDEKDEFQMTFEGELKPNGFVMAGFTDVNFDFKKAGDDTFDFYDTESICKLPVIYSVAKTRPEAGAFAPCSLYMYKKKGEDIMHIAFPNVYNWMSSLSIEDQAAIDALEDAQKRMVQILTEATE
jgi:uncharacterized protein (DUF302 family)